MNTVGIIETCIVLIIIPRYGIIAVYKTFRRLINSNI